MEEKIYIERLSYGAAGIGHTDEGKTVFVKGAVPGDTVMVSITEAKERFCNALITKIIEPSVHRVVPKCPFYDSCGGCPWQHIDYTVQLEAKRSNVVSSLQRIAHMEAAKAEQMVEPCLASKDIFAYRNKLELGASYSDEKGLLLGFYSEGTHTLITPDKCIIAHETLQKALKSIRGALRYIQGTEDLGVFRVGLRNSRRTGDTEIALWTRPGSFPRKMTSRILGEALNTTSIVRVMADPGKIRDIKGVENLSGKGFWEERLDGLRFKTSAPSFFQVNTLQAETLVHEVISALELESGARVADLYAGGGTFSLPLADKGAEVFAIEAASTSVKDLRRNALDNGLDITVIGGDSAREILSLENLDAAIVDPPRSGLTPAMISAFGEATPKKIAYVSCNPTTWARDVASLENIGYQLKMVKPVDLFPQTYHVEIVSLMSRA